MKKRLSENLLTVGIMLLFLIQFGCGEGNKQNANENGSEIIRLSDLSGGLIVHLGSGDGTLTSELGNKVTFTVHGLDTDAAKVQASRKHIISQKKYGRVSAHQYDGKNLPYIDNLVNAVVVSSLDSVSFSEIKRVLAPLGSLIYQKNNKWICEKMPWPDDIDEWNQYLNNADNNGVAKDKVGPPQRLKWTGGSTWARAHNPGTWNTVVSMVTAKGIIYTIEDLETSEYNSLPGDYYLIARDAFNGVELWRMPLKGFHFLGGSYVKFAATQSQRRVLVIDYTLYITQDASGPITAYDGRTGKLLKTYKSTENTVEFMHDQDMLYTVTGEMLSLKKNEPVPGESTIKAVRAESGRILWEHEIPNVPGYYGGTISAKGDALAYCTFDELVCLDSETGKKRWSTEIQNIYPSRKLRTSALNTGAANINPTAVMTDNAIYLATITHIYALDIKNGQIKWEAPAYAGYMKMSDIFVAQGLVWNGAIQGFDPETGELKRTSKQIMTGPMPHDRCYRNRVTHNFYINSRTGGTDFVGLNNEGEFPAPWVRSTCGLGPLPANGHVYSSPYACNCAIGSMITNFNALYNENYEGSSKYKTEHKIQLIKGKSFGKISQGEDAGAEDWPTYRNSYARSGYSSTKVSDKLLEKWNLKLPSIPTAPIIANGTVYIAGKENHTLYAIDEQTGDIKWEFIAEGRIDSPPSYFKGLVLFGSRDGWVYCLNSKDGSLVWKFTDKPVRKFMCADEQFESVWPVNGSVLVENGLVYFSAGRSSFLDGGITVYALNAFSGSLKHRQKMSGPYDDNGFPTIGARNFRIEGCKSGILAKQNDMLFIRHQGFKSDLTPVPLSDIDKAHLISSAGYLEDTPHHRSYWTIDCDLCYGTNNDQVGAGPFGDILVQNEGTFYEIRSYSPGRHGKLVPQSQYKIFSGRIAEEGEEGVWQPVWKTRDVPRTGTWKERWSVQVPFAGHAIIVADNTLIASGVPIMSDFENADLKKTYAGEFGGMLWTANTDTGQKIAMYKLPAPPVWDGMAAANGKLFISLKDGTLMCLDSEDS